MAALFIASLSVKAQTTIAAWTFDNDSPGYTASPANSSGFGTASAVGLGNGSTTPAIVSQSGSSSGLPNSWQFSATGGAGGWSTASAIGAQGAQFAASTVGNYQLQVSFDVYATANAEAALQVQYTTEGTIWHNATIASVGSGATIHNNAITTNDLVVGSYATLASGWNNQITVNLSGISMVDDAPNFAIRIVNASTGTNCLDTTGTLYNNSNNTANWTLDNVVISGIPYNVIADWPFDNLGVTKKNNFVNTPAPAIANNTASAGIIGFNLPNTLFANNVTGSTNFGDVLANGVPFSSTGSSGQDVWRLRGQNPGNGWISTQPIGTQGAEFDVSTVNYTNVIVTFDLYQTSQGEAKMCVLYTTDNWATTNVANSLSYGLNPTLIETNTTSPNTVMGTYFNNTFGSIFFNYMVVDFTGDSTVANNPNFKLRIVNAATGPDCVNYLGQPYNNSSGNTRVDNVEVSGQFTGSFPPAVTNATGVTVDNKFTNTFAVNANWATNISAIYVNGVLVTNGASAGVTITSSNFVFNPAKSTALQTSGVDQILVVATNFATATYNQFVGTGQATHLLVQQPAGPSASTGTLTINPSVGVTDQYNNGTTNPYVNLAVTATVGNSPATWILGGATSQATVNGYCTFTDLTATVLGSTAVTNAIITFAVTGYTNSSTHLTTTNFNSSAFTIGIPPVAFTRGNLAAIQIDTLSNNTTFSIIELQPSTTGQTTPVNIVPISATGTNALRLSSAGSCGKLALSDNGTFLVFDAFQDGSSATADETFNLNRAVGTLDRTNGFASPQSYVSTSFGGSQARSACSPDNQNFLIDDKGGLYINGSLVYPQNNVSVRSFGGESWVLTAKVAFPPTPSMYEFGNALDMPAIDWNPADGDDGVLVNANTNPPADEVAQDFYMVNTSTNYPFTNAVAYICDQGGGPLGANGIINKWMLMTDGVTWSNLGSWTNVDNCDTLFACTNGSGGVYLYYADGSGGTGGNSLIRLTDQSVTGPLNITSSNVIYTASANSSIEGVTFVPQQQTNATELIPAPILTPQSGAEANSTFTITNTPDDSLWRANITSIKVNGTTLSTSAYNTTHAGAMVFDGTQSALLQSAGIDNIVITAAGYSAVSVVQTLNLSAPFPVNGITAANGSVSLGFTNVSGLSFSVLGTNNITAPVATWPVVGHAVESPAGSGNYQFNASSTNGAEYFILHQP
ncbi:MAG TPA: DUF1533 domain-containing protein [Verrucomicrobiae bacterium]